MNIFTELKTKLSRRATGILNTPSDHERPQDDVPDEVILRHLRDDYHNMSRERHILITYIRWMENIYKGAQVRLLDLTSKTNKSRSKKWLIQAVRMIAYDITRSHIDAQRKLREMIDQMNSKKEETE